MGQGLRSDEGQEHWDSLDSEKTDSLPESRRESLKRRADPKGMPKGPFSKQPRPGSREV